VPVVKPGSPVHLDDVLAIGRRDEAEIRILAEERERLEPA